MAKFEGKSEVYIFTNYSNLEIVDYKDITQKSLRTRKNGLKRFCSKLIS